MKTKYMDWKPQCANKLLLIEANRILSSYDDQGYTMTIRQLFYQLAGEGKCNNSSADYHKVGQVCEKGRKSGQMDWAMIVDATREYRENVHFSSPASALYYLTQRYATNTRLTQPTYLECWFEKEALSEIFGKICDELDVGWMACKGNTSLTSIYDACINRFQVELTKGKNVVVLYAGDMDPSGVDMGRDLQERCNFYLAPNTISLNRIALNRSQLSKYIPNFANIQNWIKAKENDSKLKKYVQKYGDDKCWELDVLSPTQLHEIVKTAVDEYTDQTKLNKAIKRQKEERKKLKGLKL